MENQYQVLLYYKYTKIDDPVELMEAQKALCESLGLTGRIIVSPEGVNGTLEGTVESTEEYIQHMNNIPTFTDINYKKSKGTGKAFPRLSIKVRDEIVTSTVEGLNPTIQTGKYLSEKDLHEWFTKKKEFYIVDMRNDYEYISGQFEGSILSRFKNFRDLPKILPKLEHLKDKTIVTVCTGGVRCEKASGFLLQNGFADVYQLLNGIQTYMETYPNTHFKGKLYVFDNRITIGFNTEDQAHEIIGNCDSCGKTCDTYVNCAAPNCHRHFICCSDCRSEEVAFCNNVCRDRYLGNMVSQV